MSKNLHKKFIEETGQVLRYIAWKRDKRIKKNNSQHPKVNCLSRGGRNIVKVLETKPVDIIGTVSQNSSADV